jgi:hypothetical protein
MISVESINSKNSQTYHMSSLVSGGILKAGASRSCRRFPENETFVDLGDHLVGGERLVLSRREFARQVHGMCPVREHIAGHDQGYRVGVLGSSEIAVHVLEDGIDRVEPVFNDGQ